MDLIAYLQQIRIVLVGTTHPGNIGATARAMKTMGFRELALVTPKIFPSEVANELAAGADDILANAHVYPDLVSALAGCQLVFATSARVRYLPLTYITPEMCAARTMTAGQQQQQVAIVFGRERTGLTNDELLSCQQHVQIATDADYGSLNLAQAVQIICYTCRQAALQSAAPMVPPSNETLASADDIERFYQHLEATLVQLDFLDPDNPKRLMPRLRRLFSRTQLEEREVNILRGMLTAVNQHVGPHKN